MIFASFICCCLHNIRFFCDYFSFSNIATDKIDSFFLLWPVLQNKFIVNFVSKLVSLLEMQFVKI